MTQDGSTARVAIVTGGSQGLGLALVESLATAGWRVVTDARRPERLAGAMEQVRNHNHNRDRVVAIAGDIADEQHRDALVEAAADIGPITLVVNNASTLGASPLPGLDEIDTDVLETIFATNVIAPLALVRSAITSLGSDAIVINITSDAAVEPYDGWGGYGASKAALEQASRVLAVEHPELRVLVVDPGDMRTEMHQDAFPGEDISDRPEPAESVPGLLALIDGHAPSGRYEARSASPTGGATT